VLVPDPGTAVNALRDSTPYLKLSSTSSLLEVHLVLFNCFLSFVLLSLLLLPCSPTHPFDLNCFVIADSLFVLSNSFISCHRQMHSCLEAFLQSPSSLYQIIRRRRRAPFLVDSLFICRCRCYSIDFCNEHFLLLPYFDVVSASIPTTFTSNFFFSWFLWQRSSLSLVLWQLRWGSSIASFFGVCRRYNSTDKLLLFWSSVGCCRRLCLSKDCNEKLLLVLSSLCCGPLPLLNQDPSLLGFVLSITIATIVFVAVIVSLTDTPSHSRQVHHIRRRLTRSLLCWGSCLWWLYVFRTIHLSRHPNAIRQHNGPVRH